jgi:hypothetical protein
MMYCPATITMQPVTFLGITPVSMVDRIFMISSVVSGFATILRDGCSVIDSAECRARASIYNSVQVRIQD